MKELPSGTVTFLFTDIEGSTRLAQKFPGTYQSKLDKHDSILKEAIESNHGFLFRKIGDSLCASFLNAGDAVKAAVDSQKTLASAQDNEFTIKVRMGIHSGHAEYDNGDYLGYITLTRAQRIMSVANGGQILVTKDTADSIDSILPDNVSLRDMGERRLKDLIRSEHLYQIVSEGLPADFPALKTLDARANNLPFQTTNFIGREKEMREIKDLLKKTSLITLFGPGGAGKTRLSLQIAADLIDDFANGVWLIELAALSDKTYVISEIASVLNIKTEKDLNIADIVNFLKDKQTLLIIDNCEHLIDECARVSNLLLHSCPGLKIMTNSRESMRIDGEVIYNVSSLSLPDTTSKTTIEKVLQSESVRLFIDRALLVRRDFSINNSNAQAVAQLCRHLDGIPLAIELAAARINVLSIEQILERINDRFKFLSSSNRTASPRQQTLKALIDWSYDLLTESERLLLQRLSVFSGGCTIEAAEEVCSCNGIEQYEIIDSLSNLIDKSLVVSKMTGGRTRYSLLETIREYSYDKLAEKNDIHKEHFRYYLKLCKERSQANGMQQIEWYKAIELEKENLRSAINWATNHDPSLALELVNEIGELWDLNGSLSEGFETYNNIFKKEFAFDDELKANALLHAGYFASQLGKYEVSKDYLFEAMEIFKRINNRQKLADSLDHIGNLYFIRDELAVSEKFHEESLAIAKELNDKMRIALSSVSLATIQAFYGNLEQACRQFEEALAIFREEKDLLVTARALTNLGKIASRMGDIEKSRAYYEESLPILKEFGDQMPITISILNLGNLSLKEKNFNEAELLFEEALSVAKEFGYTNIYIHSLIKLADVALARGNYPKAKALYFEGIRICDKEYDKHKLALLIKGLGTYYLQTQNFQKAAKLFGVALSLFQNRQVKLSEDLLEDLDNKSNELTAILGEEKFRSFFMDGKLMKLNKAVEYVLSDM